MRGVSCTPLLLGACHENGSVRSRAIGTPELARHRARLRQAVQRSSIVRASDDRSAAKELCQDRYSSSYGPYRLQASSKVSRPCRTAATTSALWRGNQRLSPRRGKCASVICSPFGSRKKGTLALRASSGKVQPASLGWRPRQCVQSCAPVGWSRAFRRARARAIPLLPPLVRAWLHPAWRADRPPS